MKGIVAVILLLSVAEGRHFWKQWGPPPGHFPFHPSQTFEPPGQACPPGQVRTCSPQAQSQFPTVGPSPGFGSGNQFCPNCNQQTEFQQNGNLNTADVRNAEWFCRNPATGDMMVIVGMNGPPSQTGQNPDVLPNNNGNQHHDNSNDGSHNNGEHNHNVNTTPQPDADKSPLTHGGEGLIDIRIQS